MYQIFLGSIRRVWVCVVGGCLTFWGGVGVAVCSLVRGAAWCFPWC